jgi:hypothetical protein
MLVVESSCPQSSHIVPHMGIVRADIPGFHKKRKASGFFAAGAGLVWPSGDAVKYGVENGRVRRA